MLTYEKIFAQAKKAFVESKSATAEPAQPTEDTVPVNPDAILAITSKLLAVTRGEADPDERDSLQFKRVHTPDKLFAERIKMDAHKLRKIAMRRVSRVRNLSPIGVAHFDPYTGGLIVGHPLSSPLEETNPLSLTEQARRVTQMGPGGIPSSDSITEEAQSVSPSIFGFLSAIEGPECFSDDTEVFTYNGWKFWSSITNSDRLACRDEHGQMFFSAPSRLIAAPYTGPMVQADARMFHLKVTPNHRLLVAKHMRKSQVPTTWFKIFAGDFSDHNVLRFDTGSLPYSGNSVLTWSLPDYALDKFIPEYLFDAPISARQKLFEALLLGDGRINKNHTNFTSSSKQLATDFERLAVGLGHTTNFRKYFDKRPHVQAWTYEISILKLRERVAARKPKSGVGGLFSIVDYSGIVYCATVPGGLLLTRRGVSTGVWSGNSERIGVDTRLAWGANVGSDGKIYQKLLNRRTGQHQYVSPDDLVGRTVGIPE
jgi:hypothetical protein